MPRLRDLALRAGWPAAALALFTALAIAHTWPLGAAPGYWSRNDAPDAVLHEWIMAWVPHQLLTDPLHLFDANIFYPERLTLAYSDHLFLQSMLGAPLGWAGGSPVLVHNVVLLAGFALTGWATALVMTAWTGSRLTGVLSGSLIAFNACTLTRLAQMQDLHLEFFAPALYALDRLLVTTGTKDALRLSMWFVLQSLTGTYLMVFTAISMMAAAASRPGEWIGARFRAVAPRVLLSAAVAIVLLAPVLVPYAIVDREAGLTRSLDETARYSADFTDYLAAAGTLHFDAWSRQFWQGDGLFPGMMALLLTVVALVTGTAVTDRRARMALAIAVTTFALSFGPAFPPYRWLYAVFPPLAGIRGAVRFGQIVLAAIAILAGFGLSAVMRRFPGRATLAVAAALIVVVNAEAFRAPLGYTPYTGISKLYDLLARTGDDTVVVCFPFYPSASFHLNTPFMLASTRFWKPLVNGYSGFKPASLHINADALRDFPDARSMARLREIGVTHVVVNSRLMPQASTERIPEFPELQMLFVDGYLRLYALRR
jgi:hypothetical protein